MNINLCTVSDKKYLPQGLTLFESLKANTAEFVLHYLAIDAETQSVLSKVDDPRLQVHDIRSLIDKDGDLNALYEDEYKYFCWSLASYFTNHLLPSCANSLTYIDSDIFFYGDFQDIINAVGDKSVGVFRHRQFNQSLNYPSGWFNVGVVHFKKDGVGTGFLEWWKDAVLNKKYPQLAQCGDQKYLDAVVNLPEENVFIDGDIGHGAPWHWQLYSWDGPNIVWGGKTQKLLFNHFSQFSYDLEADTYIPSTMHHCYTPLEMYETQPLKQIHDDYFIAVKESIRKYNI